MNFLSWNNSNFYYFGSPAGTKSEPGVGTAMEVGSILTSSPN